ncbi:alpha-mannosidase [Peristeroidobacter soli]|uniref:alpha-mannosidase n=1 Tax=Peristeroidobacter soli TaxID=2497877 RepID=UPI00101BA421|nr:glycoside hydrolase family 38 C-terminal domain-containing protein [Peristeroidobacter soli]
MTPFHATPPARLVRCGLLALQLLLATSALANGGALTQRVFVIPHSHWEGQVFKTREEYLQIGLPNILKALELLENYPEYRFVLDQMCYVKPFLDRYPEKEGEFRELLRQGRVQIVGGTYTMHDSNVPTGEAIVRQYLMSKSYFRKRLNYDVTTGWAIDTFGHNAQMPQILKLAGMKSYWFQRGAPDRSTPSEFLWQGIDGTRIPAFWLPLGYGIFYPGKTPTTEIEFDNRLVDVFDQLTPFSRGHERALIAGADVFPPEEVIPVMLARFNRSPNQPFSTQFATPADFETIVAQRATQPVVTGELNPIFRGGYSTRIEMKQTMRETEGLLLTAEKLSVVASVLGGKARPVGLEQAWEQVLFNQAHDPAIGVMADHVYDEVARTYGQARRTAQSETGRAVDTILARIDTSGKGVPVAVFNTLSWSRTDLAEVDVAFRESHVRQIGLLDEKGRSVPVQILSTERDRDGGIRRARICFIAREVPALGLAIYHAISHGPGPHDVPTNSRTSMHEDSSSIENSLYRATFNLWTGAMTSLVVKDRNWEVLASSGNLVAREDDAGDWFEIDLELNPGRLTAMQMPIPAPRPARTLWSSDFGGGGGGTLTSYGGKTTVGPVFSQFDVAHPFGTNGYATRVRLYHDLARIDIRTTITNQEDHVRYRAVFPTVMTKGVATHEIPFGAIERKTMQEWPAQNWIDYSDGHQGLTLLNRGLPGGNVADGMLMLSLGRSTGNKAGRNEMGRVFTLDYALVPHVGDWRATLPWRAGLEFNHPLLAESAISHPGDVAASWGLLSVSQDNVVVSALKLAADGATVLRVYEAAGRPTRGASINFSSDVGRVHESSLIEEDGAAIASASNRIVFDLKPYEIRTFKLKFETRS